VLIFFKIKKASEKISRLSRLKKASRTFIRSALFLTIHTVWVLDGGKCYYMLCLSNLSKVLAIFRENILFAISMPVSLLVLESAI